MTRRITIVAYPDVQLLDVTGPYEVFALANRFAASSAPAPYDIEVVARPTADGGVRSSSGLSLGVHRTIDAGTRTPADRRIDTVIVVGGEGTAQAMFDEALLGWLRAVAPRCRRIASVCSGTFIL